MCLFLSLSLGFACRSSTAIIYIHFIYNKSSHSQSVDKKKITLHYVRPTLEYISVIFSPHNIFLIGALKNVQRHFTKHLPSLYNFDYIERLKICKLESLDLRRIKCDVIMLFKILHGMIHVDLCNNSIAVSNAVTRGNSYKLVKYRVRLDVREYFYVNRVVNVWNCLNDNVVRSLALHEFVLKLDSINLSSFQEGRAHR